MQSYYQIGWDQKAGELTQQLLEDTIGVALGLGRIVALCYRSSASYHNH
jgi:hypothetical protein